MKIDVFPHFLPARYKDALSKKANQKFYAAGWDKLLPKTPGLYDLDMRLRLIEQHEGLREVLTMSAPPLEMIADPQAAAELAQIGNDGLAELVAKYPDHFIAGVAGLPMNNMEAALKETDRAIKDLKLKGVQIYTPIDGKPLDAPEFLPLYEKMAEYNLPIYIHPWRSNDFADYDTESESKYATTSIFGWPYETTIAMTRLIFSGILEKYPNLKVVTHHGGGMVPLHWEHGPLGI